MAATFNSDDIERLVELEDDEQVVMVSPVGYAGDKRITEKMVRFFLPNRTTENLGTKYSLT